MHRDAAGITTPDLGRRTPRLEILGSPAGEPTSAVVRLDLLDELDRQLPSHLSGTERLVGEWRAVREVLRWCRETTRLSLVAEGGFPIAWLTTTEAAMRLGVTRQWVRYLARAGRLIGEQDTRGRWRITEESVDRELQLRTEEAA